MMHSLSGSGAELPRFLNFSPDNRAGLLLLNTIKTEALCAVCLRRQTCCNFAPRLVGRNRRERGSLM